MPKREILDCENYLCRLPKSSRDAEWWKVFILHNTLPPGVVLLPYRLAVEHYRILFDSAEIVINKQHTSQYITCGYTCAQAIADRAITKALNINTIRRAKYAS